MAVRWYLVIVLLLVGMLVFYKKEHIGTANIVVYIVLFILFFTLTLGVNGALTQDVIIAGVLTLPVIMLISSSVGYIFVESLLFLLLCCFLIIKPNLSCFPVLLEIMEAVDLLHSLPIAIAISRSDPE